MAFVTIEAENVKASLMRTLRELNRGMKWIDHKHGEVRLNIPAPYEHSVGPVSRTACFQPFRDDSPSKRHHYDECGDLAVLLGVLAKMKKGGHASK
jgi:hypothetical protein